MKGAVKAVDGEYTQSVADQDEIKKLFPNTYGMPVVTFEKSNEKKELPAMNVGVILSGGQAPGGHNVIAGLFDGIKANNAASRLYGFILGPGGLIDHKYMELTADIIDEYRNTGGFDMFRPYQTGNKRTVRQGAGNSERTEHQGSGYHWWRRLQHKCLRTGRILQGYGGRCSGNRLSEDDRR